MAVAQGSGGRGAGARPCGRRQVRRGRAGRSRRGTRARRIRTRRGQSRDSPGAVLQVRSRVAARRPSVRGAGPLRADVQCDARRQMQAGAESRFARIVRNHRIQTGVPKHSVVKARGAPVAPAPCGRRVYTVFPLHGPWLVPAGGGMYPIISYALILMARHGTCSSSLPAIAALDVHHAAGGNCIRATSHAPQVFLPAASAGGSEEIVGCWWRVRGTLRLELFLGPRIHVGQPRGENRGGA